LKEKLYDFFKFINECALYGLLFFLAISNALVESFVCLLFFCFIVRKIIKPDFKCFKFWPNFLLLLFWLLSALSLCNSFPYLKISLNALFGKWLQYFLICVLVQDIVYDYKTIKRAMTAFLLGASLAVFSGLSQHFFGVEFLRHKSKVDVLGGFQGVTASFNHYNAFGAYLVVVLSLTVALLLAGNHSRFKTRCLSIFAVLSTLALIFTFSRGSWLGMMVAFIFLVILSKRYPKWFIPSLFITLVVSLLFFSVRSRFFYSFQPGGDSERFRKWLVAISMIKEHPFLGMGVGTFMANFSKYLPADSPAYTHNCYLQICSETGVLSLITFLVFVISLFYLGSKEFFKTKDYLLLGLLSGMAGYLAHSFFEVNLYSLRLAVLFWTWAGLIIAVIRFNQKENGRESRCC